jgi:hypothetical protein
MVARVNKSPKPNHSNRSQVGRASKGDRIKSSFGNSSEDNGTPTGAENVDPDMKHREFLDAVKYCCKWNSGVFVTCYRSEAKIPSCSKKRS